MKSSVGLMLGDPCGVGPEVTAKLLAQEDIRAETQVVLVADRDVFAEAQRVARTTVDVQDVAAIADADPDDTRPVLLHHQSEGGGLYPVGKASADGGLYAIQTFRKLLDLARAGSIGSICFAPMNKQALNMATERHEPDNKIDEPLDWIAKELGYSGNRGLISYLDGFWTSRVTNHVPIKEISDNLTPQGIIDTVRLTHDAIAASGLEAPRIAVAALNPHGGDGGLFGREEIDIIEPTVVQLAAEGLAIEGPFPTDTVFVRAQDGLCDAVVTMYHDQGQLAMKLLGFHRGVTIWAGMPIPILTPAQGSAFDISGKGIASEGALTEAFKMASRMATAQSIRTDGARPGP